MARDDEDTPRPRGIPRPFPPRRDTPPTRPSPARTTPKREVVVEDPSLASIYGVVLAVHGSMSKLGERIEVLEKAEKERQSSPPSQVISFASTPLPTPAELLETPVPSSKPESRPSLPVRAAKATGQAAKAVGKNQVVRGVLLAAGVFPYVAQVVAWFRKVDVGPIVSALRLLADTIEGLNR